MMRKPKKRPFKKMSALLRVLLVIFAGTAVIAGIYAVTGGANHPQAAGKESLFGSFVVPGILLALVVGATNLYAAVINIRRKPHRYDWAITGGVAIALWVMIQMMLTGSVNWLQMLYLTTGLLVVLIAFQLKGKWIV